MGLDVYLYRYENKEATTKLESEYETQSEKNWADAGEYKTLSDEEKEIVRIKNKEFALSLGLHESGEDKVNKTMIEHVSKYPDHYFKIGYFRSLYNGGGINRVLSNFGIGDLYSIFNRKDEDEYIFKPNWALAKSNAIKSINELRAVPNLRCFNVGWNEFKGSPQNATIQSAEQAMEVFINRSKTFAEDDDGFSNSDGEFFPKGLKVFGLISGVNKRFFVEEKLPSVYVICEGENQWYIQALEIVVETIDFVLSQPDQDKYYLHWSS